jgi:hypothetical protein
MFKKMPSLLAITMTTIGSVLIMTIVFGIWVDDFTIDMNPLTGVLGFLMND